MAARTVMPWYGIGGQAAGEPVGRGAGCAGEVAVDGDFDEVGAGDVREGFEAYGEGGDGGLNPVRAQVMAEAAHEARVVDLADRILILLLDLGFCGLVFLVGHAGSGDSALQFHCTVRQVFWSLDADTRFGFGGFDPLC